MRAAHGAAHWARHVVLGILGRTQVEGRCCMAAAAVDALGTICATTAKLCERGQRATGDFSKAALLVGRLPAVDLPVAALLVTELPAVVATLNNMTSVLQCAGWQRWTMAMAGVARAAPDRVAARGRSGAVAPRQLDVQRQGAIGLSAVDYGHGDEAASLGSAKGTVALPTKLSSTWSAS
eukprot:CAMPEP_0180657448 /NCGR_PEP_ID=MMETSP1037_2-20121125/56431_1 /TAXON_ID=632150 /ORGANISM="Azadinium spinosum, Strain 3D9" /LENGTH=179 /DNA_ID=CAMNT_0022684179 /DNA_START=378 /DNA_END=919 /DNA_ORIENTATION=-